MRISYIGTVERCTCGRCVQQLVYTWCPVRRGLPQRRLLLISKAALYCPKTKGRNPARSSATIRLLRRISQEFSTGPGQLLQFSPGWVHWPEPSSWQVALSAYLPSLPVQVGAGCSPMAGPTHKADSAGRLFGLAKQRTIGVVYSCSNPSWACGKFERDPPQQSDCCGGSRSNFPQVG